MIRTKHARLILVVSLLLAAVAGAVFAARARQQRLDEQWAREALAAVETGDRSRIAAAILGADTSPSREPHRRLLRAAELLHEGRTDTSLEVLSGVRPAGELRFATLLTAGRGLYRLKRLAEAERVLLLLAAENPERPEPHRYLATIYHELGAMDAALAELQRVARLEPNDFLVHRLMGLLYSEDRAEYDKAVLCYRNALQREPPEFYRDQILRELGQVLVHQRDYAGALDALSQLKNDARALALRANCLWSLGQHKEAREVLDRALAFSAQERTALSLAARIHMESRHPERAIEPLEAALALDPHDIESRYQLALAYRKLGNVEAAEAELAKMQESQALRGKYEELYLKAMSDPYDAEIRQELAGLCRELGQNSLADNWAQAAGVSRRLQAAQ